MKISIITKDEIVPSIWSGGETFEYFIYPPNSSYTERNFLFRISTATINLVPSNFTRFNNFNRFLVMLDNDLNIINNGALETYKRNEIFSFDSNNTITSNTMGTDFNLMIHKSIGEASVQIVNNVVQTQDQFIFLFALTNSLLHLNSEQFQLNESDLLMVENSEKKLITIKSFQDILFCQLTL